MSEANPLVFTRKFEVRGHDVNGDEYLTVPTLLRYLQDCSLEHARSLKNGIWNLEAEDISWVLLRKQLDIISPLKIGEKFTVITYPSGFDKFFASRDYLVFNEDKKLVAGASSSWAIIDMESRKIGRIPEQIIKIGTPKNLKFLPEPEKTIVPPNSPGKVDRRIIRPYDLDWNDHVNNIVLVRFMLESLKSRDKEDQDFQKLLFLFKNEVLQDASVDVWLEEGEKNSTVLLKDEFGKMMTYMKVDFRK